MTKMNRREFVRIRALAGAPYSSEDRPPAAAAPGRVSPRRPGAGRLGRGRRHARRSRLQPAAVHRRSSRPEGADRGEESGQRLSSFVSPDDVVGIKINCIGAPRISSSIASIDETIAGLKGAGVKENNIVVWTG